MNTPNEALTPNHPAVKAAVEDQSFGTLRRLHGASRNNPQQVLGLMRNILRTAIRNLTADDLRDTQAGQALMAEALEDEACRMDVVISNGDAAEQAAPAPGETGRGGAVTARDALYENPAQYLRERADAYRTETTHE